MPETKPSPASFPDTLYSLDPGPECPRVVRMIVEIPRNSSHKYEYDPGARTFRLDRPLYSPMHYPADYGFIPGTIAEDGDPLDILCLIDQPTFTGCLIEVRPIGVLNMIDQTAVDQKVIGVPVKDPRFEQTHTIDDLQPHLMREFEHFFAIYKELENKTVETRGWSGEQDAFHAIAKSRVQYQKALSELAQKRKP